MAKFVMPTRIVLVEWLDALSGETGWKSWKHAQKQKPCLVHTIGYVGKEDDTFITILGSIIVEDGTHDGDVTIPKPMIQKITELKAWVA